MSQEKIELGQRRNGAVITAVVAIIAVTGLGVLLWEEHLEDRVVSDNLGMVEPGLYRSGQISKHLIGPMLREHEVDVIISMSYDNPENADNMAEAAAARKLDIPRYQFPLRGDGTGDPASYVDAVEQVVDARKNGETVLVHCSAGAQRTSGVIGLYRVLVQEHDPAVAVREMFEFEHDPDDNPELLPYLNEHLPTIARGLVQRGILETMPEPLPVFPTLE